MTFLLYPKNDIDSNQIKLEKMRDIFLWNGKVMIFSFWQIKVMILKCIKYNFYTYEKGHANVEICPKVSTLDPQLPIVSVALACCTIFICVII
jgi:hypothetical protein